MQKSQEVGRVSHGERAMWKVIKVDRVSDLE